MKNNNRYEVKELNYDITKAEELFVNFTINKIDHLDNYIEEITLQNIYIDEEPVLSKQHTYYIEKNDPIFEMQINNLYDYFLETDEKYLELMHCIKAANEWLSKNPAPADLSNRHFENRMERLRIAESLGYIDL